VLQPATPEGFEMLVDNFSLGILGTVLAVVSKNVIGPILSGITDVLAEEKISIFAISTFDTDYILIKREYLTTAVSALERAGYQFN
ncbi:MAG: ACT domain-containing protein, partial [SAR324 cluster bacterium]|nr:ACT domain-containing protein [SAR324 cluster bacterium]